jgi:methyl-accepting chemotaxis protein
MGKHGNEDIYDCAACGYGSCEAMAKAIHNGLNKAENCYHYQKRCLEDDQRRARNLSEELHAKIMDSEERMTHLRATMAGLADRCADQAATIEESSAAIENMLKALEHASSLSMEKRDTLETIADGSRQGETRLAGMITLLSMNAAIEAAHAGAAGKGFAVISNEVKRLADSSTKNSAQISKDLTAIERKIATSAQSSLEATNAIRTTMGELSQVADGIKSLFDLLSESSAGSTQLQEALRQMRESTVSMSESHDQILRDLGVLATSVSDIRSASDENLKVMATV